MGRQGRARGRMEDGREAREGEGPKPWGHLPGCWGTDARGLADGPSCMRSCKQRTGRPGSSQNVLSIVFERQRERALATTLSLFKCPQAPGGSLEPETPPVFPMWMAGLL